MGNKVSLLLVLIVNSFLPGLGLLLIPERGTVTTLFAVLYFILGGFGILSLFALGLGIFLWLPVLFVSSAHTLVAAQMHNSRVATSRTELEGRLSQVEQADPGLGDLANY